MKIKEDEKLLRFMEEDINRPWYQRWFPPIWHYNESMHTFTFQLWDCSVVHKSLTKIHRFDVLIKMHRKWWQPKYIGFHIWLYRKGKE